MTIYILDAFEPTGVRYITGQCADVVRYGNSRTATWHDDAVGLMVRGARLTADDFAKAKRLRVVAKQGVGTDNIDLAAAKRHGIVVCTMPGGVNSYAVAELAFGLAVSVARRISELDRRVRAGEKIVRPDLLGMELRGKTVGVIGMGSIGIEAARLFQNAYACKILAFDPYAPANCWQDVVHERITDLRALWPRVDLLTLHVPLTDETRHIVDAAAIRALKKDAMVVNVSRGGLIDEVALHAALSAGALFGAGLDAFEEGEPPRPDNPLLSLPNVVATPHVGGGTRETQMTSSLMTAKQLWDVLNGGVPLHRVA